MADNKFKTRLEIAKKKIKKNERKSGSRNAASLGKALKIRTELVAAVVVGTTMGYILDSWFGTKPLLIICFFIIGVVAGIMNVFRAAKRMEKN